MIDMGSDTLHFMMNLSIDTLQTVIIEMDSPISRIVHHVHMDVYMHASAAAVSASASASRGSCTGRWHPSCYTILLWNTILE